MCCRKYLTVSSIHIFTGLLSLAIGIGFPFTFGWYDQCFTTPDEIVVSWSFYRDFTDLYLSLIFIGFLHFGFAGGILKLRSIKNAEYHKVKFEIVFRYCLKYQDLI
jgi:hypothetical protein